MDGLTEPQEEEICLSELDSGIIKKKKSFTVSGFHSYLTCTLKVTVWTSVYL